MPPTPIPEPIDLAPWVQVLPQPEALAPGSAVYAATSAGAGVVAVGALGPEGGAIDVLERVMDLGAAAACAEGVGVLRSMLEMTTEYLKVREQFGVKIGTI